MNCQICNEVFPSNKRSGEKTDYVKHYRSVHNDIPPEFKGKNFDKISKLPQVVYVPSSFWLLDPESRDLSQAELGIIVC